MNAKREDGSIQHNLTREEERWTVLETVAFHLDWIRGLVVGNAGPWRGFDELGLPRQRIEAALSEIETQLAALKRMAKRPFWQKES
jgi:hypothetical protein